MPHSWSTLPETLRDQILLHLLQSYYPDLLHPDLTITTSRILEFDHICHKVSEVSQGMMYDLVSALGLFDMYIERVWSHLPLHEVPYQVDVVRGHVDCCRVRLLGE